jgi:formamidopyrimidine-DNA glycosylase
VPELPEVETVRRGLNLVTLNQTIQGCDILLDRTLAYPASAVEFLEGLQGSAIAQWHRRGKYLLAEVVRESGGSQIPDPLIQNPKSQIQNPLIQNPKSKISPSPRILDSKLQAPNSLFPTPYSLFPTLLVSSAFTYA